MWTDNCETAFCGLQVTLTTSPVLILPDYDKPFTLITDASDFVTRAILEQDDVLGQSHPVAYYSKSLQPAECNYEIHNKELLAIIHVLHHFHHYLQGSKHTMKIFLDHVNLKYFTTKQTLTCCQARWALFLATFPYEIIPKPGSTNKADALSRCPDYKEGIAIDNAKRVLLTPDKFHIQALQTIVIPLAMDIELKAAIQAAIKDDHLSGPLLQKLIVNGPCSTTKGLEQWNYENGLILYKGLVYMPNNKNLKHKVM
jgi:hypothetical protein